MLFKEVIKLISITDDTNAMGDTIKTPVESADIFADKQSIGQSEFYQAAAAGLKPELKFTIRTCDYNNQPQIEFNNKTYNIIRAYEKDSEFIELTCQGVVNNGIT